MTNRKDTLEKIKAFGMTNQMVTEEIQQIGERFSVDLGHTRPSVPDGDLTEIYYPQFDASVRTEASAMSRHYETFYCLEKSIRDFVSEILKEAEKTEDWWTTPRVPHEIGKDVTARIQREVDSGTTRRSLDELDYTTFGELSVLITSNWDVFGGTLSSRKAVEKVMASLNMLRGPIAHCSPLSEDEELRLRLAVRDWFRLME